MNFVTVLYFLIFLKSHVRYGLYESGKYKTNSSLFSPPSLTWMMGDSLTTSFQKASVSYLVVLFVLSCISFLTVCKCADEEYCPKSSASRQVNTLLTDMGFSSCIFNTVFDASCLLGFIGESGFFARFSGWIYLRYSRTLWLQFLL